VQILEVVLPLGQCLIEAAKTYPDQTVAGRPDAVVVGNICRRIAHDNQRKTIRMPAGNDVVQDLEFILAL